MASQVGRPVGNGQVVADRGIEEMHVLRHHGEQLARGLLGQVAELDAVDADAADLVVPEAHQQGHQRGLATAAGTDERDALARIDAQVEVAEDPGVPVAVAERETLQLQGRRTATGALRHHGPGRVLHGGRRIDDLEQPPGRGPRRVQQLQGSGERLDRLEGGDGREGQGRKEDALQPAAGHERDGQHEDRQAGQGGQQPGQRIADGLDAAQPASCRIQPRGPGQQLRTMGFGRVQREEVGDALQLIDHESRRVAAQARQRGGG